MTARDEEHDLAQADRHIAGAEERIARQVDLLAAARAAGGDVAPAETLLATMERSLTAMREHRRLILEALGRQG